VNQVEIEHNEVDGMKKGVAAEIYSLGSKGPSIGK